MAGSGASNRYSEPWAMPADGTHHSTSQTHDDVIFWLSPGLTRQGRRPLRSMVVGQEESGGVFESPLKLTLRDLLGGQLTQVDSPPLWVHSTTQGSP